MLLSPFIGSQVWWLAGHLVTCHGPWDIETQSPYLSDMAALATSSGPITMPGALVDGAWFHSVWIQFLGYSTVIACKGWWLIHTNQPYLPLSTKLEGTWCCMAPGSQCPSAHEVWQWVYLTAPWMLRCSFVYKGEWLQYAIHTSRSPCTFSQHH